MTHWLTLLVSTSPCAENPRIDAITTVIQTMRAYKGLEDVPALIMFDAPYDNLKFETEATYEQGADASADRFNERVSRYEEYKRNLLPWCQENNVETMVFTSHTHRANMTREALKRITTPCILPIDHDVIIQGDINWENMRKAMENPQVNAIRLYYFEAVHPDHKHLVEFPRQYIEGVPLLRTIQYGDTPNIQRTDFLRSIIEKYIGKDSQCFVEAVMWPVCHEAGFDNWQEFKLFLYAPDNMKCQNHLNIRGSFPMSTTAAERLR